MTLEDLLDYTVKHVLRDTGTPRLWPDDLITMYLDEGNKKVATRTHAFVNSTRTVEIAAGEDVYDLDDDIVYVYSVRLDGYPGRLTLSSEDWTPDTDAETRPTRYTLDRESQVIRFYAVPDQAYTAILRCATMPPTLSYDDLEAEVEILDRFKLAPADWAAYRCLSNNDYDGFNQAGADKALERFFSALGEYKRDEYRLKTGHNARARGMRVK